MSELHLRGASVLVGARSPSGVVPPNQARVLRKLWPRLGLVTVLEYKSPVDSAFRPGDLLRLVGCGVLYDTSHLDELPQREDLTLVLVVASLTPNLLKEMKRMGWTLTALGGGYGRIDGVVYTTFVVITDEVTESERDEYLRLFSHRPAEQGEATRWLQQWMRDTKMKQPNIEELPGYEEMFQKLVEAMPLEKRLAGLAPEQVLGAFAPEQRLAGLPTEQLILALPVDVLRVLPEEYLRSLPRRGPRAAQEAPSGSRPLSQPRPVPSAPARRAESRNACRPTRACCRRVRRRRASRKARLGLSPGFAMPSRHAQSLRSARQEGRQGSPPRPHHGRERMPPNSCPALAAVAACISPHLESPKAPGGVSRDALHSGSCLP